MQLRPVFYISEWQTEDSQILKVLIELNWPFLIDAHELQRLENPESFLKLFSKDQLQILSADVDDDVATFSRCIEYCVKKSWTHLIHVNNFSINVISELKESEKWITKNPLARIAFVPKKRAILKNNVFIQRLFDLGEKDYRNLKSQVVIYPVLCIKDRTFKKNDLFIHEKLLIHCLRKDCGHISIPVEYNEKIKEDTDFFSWRASLFNWWLVALTSLQNSSRPAHSALSLAMGVFIACTPFYGLQTFLIISGAFIFRLSFPIAFLGSQVSLPPIYALIVPLQVYIGFKMTGRSFNLNGDWLEIAQSHFTSWLLGSIVVGGILSALMGGLWYLLQIKQSRTNVN